MNHRAKLKSKFPKLTQSKNGLSEFWKFALQFDAASFILGGEILNRTKLHTNTQTNKQTNSNRYIHTLPIGMCG